MIATPLPVRQCRIVTPEGVTIAFSIAAAGDRSTAFLLDLLVIAAAIAAIAVMGFAFIAAIDFEVGTIAIALLQVTAFFIFNFYFIGSEISASGTTFGKRKMGLRVIARDGGPLTAEMIVARNLTRDLEIYLPVNVLMAPEAVFGQSEGIGVATGAVWLLVLLLFPLFNKQRLRLGDLIGGTVVVDQPTASLLLDLADTRPQRSRNSNAAQEFVFTRQQLEHYGIHELQVLEEIFRKHTRGQAPPELLSEISGRIQRRIGWPAGQAPHDDVEFLRTFYTAQRAHLEKKLVMGKRKERKSDS